MRWISTNDECCWLRLYDACHSGASSSNVEDAALPLGLKLSRNLRSNLMAKSGRLGRVPVRAAAAKNFVQSASC